MKKIMDSDLLYEMIKCLDYDTFTYGNMVEYTIGLPFDINPHDKSYETYGVKNKEDYENNKPTGFWFMYF